MNESLWLNFLKYYFEPYGKTPLLVQMITYKCKILTSLQHLKSEHQMQVSTYLILPLCSYQDLQCREYTLMLTSSFQIVLVLFY